MKLNFWQILGAILMVGGGAFLYWEKQGNKPTTPLTPPPASVPATTQPSAPQPAGTPNP